MVQSYRLCLGFFKDILNCSLCCFLEASFVPEGCDCAKVIVRHDPESPNALRCISSPRSSPSPSFNPNPSATTDLLYPFVLLSQPIVALLATRHSHVLHAYRPSELRFRTTSYLRMSCNFRIEDAESTSLDWFSSTLMIL